MKFKGTKDVFKISTATTQGTPMCLPNNAIYAGKIRLAQVFGNTVEEATANTILLSKAPEMLEMLTELVKQNQMRGYGESEDVLKAKKLIKEATTL